MPFTAPASAGFVVRGMALYGCASCYLALTPLIAHDLMGQSSGIYGILLASTGIGSILGGVVLSAVRRHDVPDDRLLTICCAVSALALIVLSQGLDPRLASLALAVAGGSTLIQLATLNAAAQMLLPEAVRGRGLSIYMAVTFGCMAVGSLFWGAISDTFSISAALLLGGAGFLASAFLGRYARLADARP